LRDSTQIMQTGDFSHFSMPLLNTWHRCAPAYILVIWFLPYRAPQPKFWWSGFSLTVRLSQPSFSDTILAICFSHHCSFISLVSTLVCSFLCIHWALSRNVAHQLRGQRRQRATRWLWTGRQRADTTTMKTAMGDTATMDMMTTATGGTTMADRTTQRQQRRTAWQRCATLAIVLLAVTLHLQSQIR
jgi:hypothetical protein